MKRLKPLKPIGKPLLKKPLFKKSIIENESTSAGGRSVNYMFHRKNPKLKKKK
jgi:hypothetical protein